MNVTTRLRITMYCLYCCWWRWLCIRCTCHM